MRKCMTIAAVAVVLTCVSGTQADVFGTGDNQFTIDFVPIPGNPGVTRAFNTSGDPIETFTAGVVGDYTDPGDDFRISVHEITNAQWAKFQAELGVPVTGYPGYSYDEDPYWTGANVPTNNASWYEAAQFVNWLNTSTGHQAAYKFVGTQGGTGYAMTRWSAAEADNGTNLYRHKDAVYHLPTEDEWVKAAYWNGSDIQTWATPDDTVPDEDVEANYGDEYNAQPWDVGSGSEELNGTFDMMGNIYEWVESPHSDAEYGPRSDRGARGGAYNYDSHLASSIQNWVGPTDETISWGFRVASVPEPSSLGLILFGGLALLKRRRWA